MSIPIGSNLDFLNTAMCSNLVAPVAEGDIVNLGTLNTKLGGKLNNALPINASTNPLFPAGNIGDTYNVTAAGTVGGVAVSVGDFIIRVANTATPATDNIVLRANTGGGSSPTYTKGNTVPTSPTKGSLWVELDALNEYVEEWFWTGAYWLSSQLYRYSYSTIATNGVSDFFFPVEQAYNLFLVSLISSIQIQNLSNASNFYNWLLFRVASGGTNTLISVGTSSSQALGSYINQSISVNTLINVASTATTSIRIVENRTGTPTKLGTIGFTFRRSRI